MLGKDLIDYIKEKDLLEYDFPIYCEKDNKWAGFLTLTDAAKTFSLPISQIKEYAKNGKIESHIIDGRMLIKYEDMKRRIEENEQ